MAQKLKAQSGANRNGHELLLASFLATNEHVARLSESLPEPRPTNGKPQSPSGTAIFSEQAWMEIARRLKLSRRELQIVRSVFDDYTETAIAGNLNIAKCTVHEHCQRLYRKLKVTDRVQLVLLVVEEFLSLAIAPGNGLTPACANLSAGRCPLRSNLA
jgi:DNA-binding NarL/FixJ family response regulator